MRPALKLYGREYCSLCRVMREALVGQGLPAEWIDIDDHPDLEARYGELVPVLTGGKGEMICHYHLDQRALDAYLADLS